MLRFSKCETRTKIKAWKAFADTATANHWIGWRDHCEHAWLLPVNRCFFERKGAFVRLTISISSQAETVARSDSDWSGCFLSEGAVSSPFSCPPRLILLPRLLSRSDIPAVGVPNEETATPSALILISSIGGPDGSRGPGRKSAVCHHQPHCRSQLRTGRIPTSGGTASIEEGRPDRSIGTSAGVRHSQRRRQLLYLNCRSGVTGANLVAGGIPVFCKS